MTNETSVSGILCAKLTREFNFRFNVAELIGPSVNLSSFSAPILTFKLAAAEVFPEHVNTLKVFASIDCEQNWIELYSRSGQQLVTSSSTEPEFIPQGGGDWRMESINLNALANEDHVLFKFVYYRDSLPQPNNVFIDDINIGSPDLTSTNNESKHFNVFPNPSTGNIFLNAPLNSSFFVELYDSKGTLIKSKQRSAEANNTINLSDGKNMPKGLYLVKVYASDVMFTKKIIVE
jgi:hypothetical protein